MASGAGAAENLDVAGVHNIETAVGEADAQALALPFPNDLQGLLRSADRARGWLDRLASTIVQFCHRMREL